MSDAKRCRRCDEDKPLTEFGNDRARKDGLRPYCKPCVREYNREYTESHREESRARFRKYAASPAGKAKQAAWKAENAERQPVYKATYRAKNPQAARAYYERTKTEAHQRVLKRRAIKRAVTIGAVDLDALWQASGGVCALCCNTIDPELRGPHPMSKSVDHIIPLSRGGMHEQSNLQWTHLVCNKKKGATVPSTDSGRVATPTQGSGSHHG